MAGLIVGLAGESVVSPNRVPGRAGSRPVPWIFLLTCAFLAAAPDLDYIHPPFHRGPTHSIGAVAIVALIAAAVTRWTTGHVRWRVALVCALAYCSHIVMDWLGQDRTLTPGLQALWPFTETLFMSGWDWFRSTERVDAFVQPQLGHNVLTLAREMLLLGPLLAWVGWRRWGRR